MFDYESKHQKPLSRRAFRQRLTYNGLIALGLVVFALAIGMLIYMGLDGRSAIDAFLSSSMILSGMGPVGDIPADHVWAKFFAGVYAIFCGLLIFAIAGIVLTPIIHRVLHKFHVPDDDKG